jgi:hypothetical protein
MWMEMVEKIRSFWHDQIPAWVPIALTILGAAFWLGQQQQSIADRLHSLEIQMQDVQNYLRSHSTGRDGGPPISANVPPEVSTVPME